VDCHVGLCYHPSVVRLRRFTHRPYLNRIISVVSSPVLFFSNLTNLSIPTMIPWLYPLKREDYLTVILRSFPSGSGAACQSMNVCAVFACDVLCLH
jgi:hypothetical protein